MSKVDFSFLCDFESATLCTFKKGEFIINQGEQFNYIYLIVKEICEHLEYSADGDEIVYFEKTTDGGLDAVIGLNHLWLPNYTAISSFLAKTDLVCIRVEIEEAKKEILMHSDVVEAILYQLAVKYYYVRSMFNFRHDRRISN